MQAAAAGDGRKEDMGRERPAGQRGVAGGESGARFCKRGTGCGHLRTRWRGAKARAASLQDAGPEQDTRAARCGVAQGEITESQARAPRDAAGDGRTTDLGRGRPAGLPTEYREKRFAIWARIAGIFGRRT